MDLHLKDKVVIITGGTEGIGQAMQVEIFIAILAGMLRLPNFYLPDNFINRLTFDL